MKTKTRGLEPIVAAVLLIVVAVIGAVLVYLWFAGYVTKATSQAESMAASEKLKIEAASLKAGAGGAFTAELYVRNLGGDTVKVVDAYVFKPGSTNVLCRASSVSANPDPIPPGQLSTITVDLPATCGITAGYDYVIKLVTQKGTEFAVTVTAS
jgi:FlaG/FlaF family flagellin (archaellin)